jgi:hypothetical protein
MPREIESTGRPPLVEYPWVCHIDNLLSSDIGKDARYRTFLFDCVMSLAYIDASAGLEKSIEHCKNCIGEFNAHVGFINLCSPCLEAGEWKYQKAAKPQSGALGKLSSEVILKFVEFSSTTFVKVLAIGGSDYADAYLEHKSGIKILAEVKSAPLITYPLLIKIENIGNSASHSKIVLTSSQFNSCNSALYLHIGQAIPLGKVGSENWPFKTFVEFVTNPKNKIIMEQSLGQWNEARKAYIDKDKSNKMYYFTNACGAPPIEAKRNYGWPQSEVISDGKTSAGMDRTDDIKKGIYQTLKIGVTHKKNKKYKTAIISNLPAYRHGENYVDPIIPVMWGMEGDIKKIAGIDAITRDDLRYIFDYIITLESPLLRDLSL